MHTNIHAYIIKPHEFVVCTYNSFTKYTVKMNLLF